jgi:hypothetical protein
MHEHPEIVALKKYFKKCNIKICKSGEAIRDDLFLVDFSVDGKTWQLLLDDEYRDFHPKKPVVNLFLTLSALELYEEAEDFLVWCNYLNLDTSGTRWLDYYRSLGTAYREIEQTLGKIDSCITPLDYQLRTGVVSALLQTDV